MCGGDTGGDAGVYVLDLRGIEGRGNDRPPAG